MASSVNDNDMERGEAGKEANLEKTGNEAQKSPRSMTLTNASTCGSTPPQSYIQRYWNFIFVRGRSSADSLQPKQPPKIRNFSSCPEGYPNLAVFLDSSEEFMLYRRFGFLQSRLLLNKQDQLRVLEKRLDKEDGDDFRDNKKLLKSRARDEVQKTGRVKLFVEIETKFKEYVELLTAAQTLAAFSKPAKRDYVSVRNYIDDKSPLLGEEGDYILCKEDLITIKPGRENAWLDAFVENMLRKICCRPVRYIFCSPEMREKADENTILYDRDRINVLVTAIITSMIIALLIVPIYLLWHISRVVQTNKITAITIGVLLIFTLFFSTVLSFFTRARRHEILGAAAAYCAVLVVFMANTTQNSPLGPDSKY